MYRPSAINTQLYVMSPWVRGSAQIYGPAACVEALCSDKGPYMQTERAEGTSEHHRGRHIVTRWHVAGAGGPRVKQSDFQTWRGYGFDNAMKHCDCGDGWTPVLWDMSRASKNALRANE